MSASSSPDASVSVVLTADLHARPAGQVTRAISAYDAQVRLVVDDRVADARSVLAVMGLGAVTGQVVEVTGDGPQAQAAVDAVAAVLKAAADSTGSADPVRHRRTPPRPTTGWPPSLMEVESTRPGVVRAPRQDTRMESNTLAQRWLAEALGTGFLVFIGAGSVPATLILGNAADVPFSMADLGMISFAFMLVIVGMVYALGHISGCHINPAVTVALAATGKFPWREVPGYIGAQVVGATAGALAIVGTLGQVAADLGLGMTTYGDSTPWARATFAEAIGTALLAFVIFGVIDGRAAPGWAGLAIGSIVFAIIIVVGPATGASLNPARYLGPMLVGEGFDATVQWSQLPAYFIGEFVGALAGAFAYLTLARTKPSTVPTQQTRVAQEVSA